MLADVESFLVLQMFEDPDESGFSEDYNPFQSGGESSPDKMREKREKKLRRKVRIR